MSTLLCQCGSVVPVEESVGMQCVACHEAPLRAAFEALRPFAVMTYELVRVETPEIVSFPTMRATFSQRDVIRAREAYRAAAIEHLDRAISFHGFIADAAREKYKSDPREWGLDSVFIGGGGGGGGVAKKEPGK
jgi:hypothetical protein